MLALSAPRIGFKKKIEPEKEGHGASEGQPRELTI
jgi:hypothetical protein